MHKGGIIPWVPTGQWLDVLSEANLFDDAARFLSIRYVTFKSVVLWFLGHVGQVLSSACRSDAT